MTTLANFLFKQLSIEQLRLVAGPFLRSATVAMVAVSGAPAEANSPRTVILVMEGMAIAESKPGDPDAGEPAIQFSHEMLDAIVRKMVDDQAAPAEAQAAALSPRECDVLDLLRDGASNKMIARDLNIAETTVKIHVRNILAKTSCRNRTQAALWSRSHQPKADA